MKSCNNHYGSRVGRLGIYSEQILYSKPRKDIGILKQTKTKTTKKTPELQKRLKKLVSLKHQLKS